MTLYFLENAAYSLAMPKRFRGHSGAWVRVAAVSAVMLAALSGCNEAEHKKQLADAQSQADKKIAQVEAQAKERISVLEKQVESLKADAEAAATKAKADAEEAVAKAQASVDDAEKETAKALAKAREAYKSEAKARYASLNKELADVTAKAQKVPAKSKAAFDKALKDLVALQKEVTKDIAAYDQATLDSFAKTKAKLDVDLAKYKGLVKAAKSKVPA
ncbi:MAG: hypothetical protein QM784_00260 [Polyangiaceae bacterium]